MTLEKKLMILGAILYVFGDGIEGCVQKLITPTTQKQYSDICKHNLPHTKIIPNERGWLISIDGTNEYDGSRLGHNTKLQLNPGQRAEIEFIGGKINYNTIGGYSYVPWENRTYENVREYLGERVRYKIPFAGNNVLVVLRANKEQRVFKITNRVSSVTNPLSHPATIYLFYNGIEYYLENGKLEDEFRWIGCDGSKMYFEIYKY